MNNNTHMTNKTYDEGIFMVQNCTDEAYETLNGSIGYHQDKTTETRDPSEIVDLVEGFCPSTKLKSRAHIVFSNGV